MTLLIPTSEKNLSIGPTEGEGLGLVLVEEVVLVEELEEEVVDTDVDEVLLDSDDADEELLTEDLEPGLVPLAELVLTELSERDTEEVEDVADSVGVAEP